MSDLIAFNGRSPDDPPHPSGQNGFRGIPEDDGESVDLRELLAVFRRQVWVVLGITTVVFGGMVFIVVRHIPQYQASATVRLQDERRALAGGLAGAAQEMIGPAVDPILSQVQVLRSRGVAMEVVERTGLRLSSVTPNFSAGFLKEVQIAEPGVSDTLHIQFEADAFIVQGRHAQMRGAYGEPVLLPDIRFTIPARPSGIAEAVVLVLPQAVAIERFNSKLRGTVRDRTNVVDVTYVDADPEWAQRIVNTTMEVFRSVSARSAQAQAMRRRVFLDEQLTQTDSALAHARLALTDFQQREGVASSQEKLTAQQVGLMDLDVRREELAADRQVLRSFLITVSDENQTGNRLGSLVSNPGVVQNPAVSALFQQLVRLELSRDSLTMGEWGRAQANPDVQRLNLLIGSTRSRLLEAIESHSLTLDARIAALDDLRARNLVELQSLPVSGAEEVRLVQQVEGIGKVADQLREEYQRARIAEAVEAGQVEILDLAPLPMAPIGSGRVPKLALSLVLGLMLGSGAAFLRERLNTSIHRKEDLEILRLPNLAVIPQFATRGEGRPLLSFPGATTHRNGTDRSITSGTINELVTVSDLRSSGSEAYRTLRTNLIFSQAVQSLKTLVVTSSTPAEGKTTTAANLAVAFAQQGIRVLVVDCDLRKGRLHDVFHLSREPGLTQLVLGFNAASDVVQKTAVDGLFVLPSGTLPPNPSELLGGERMREELQALSKLYDVVILDTPPLLAASDASVLGRYCDGVLLVVRAGHTDRAAAQQAVEQLRTVGANVVGAVLNDPDSKMESYGGYYRYDYYGAEA